LLATNGITSPSGSQTYGPLVADGPSASRQFSFIASGTNGQSIDATFQLQSGTNNLGIGIFNFILGISTNTFANTNIIIINDDTTATPYPSIINVNGVGGSVGKATVVFAGLTHTWPADIDAVLESPSKQSTLLMANAGAGNSVHNVTLTFDDAASVYLPQNGQIVSGVSRPTPYFPVATFPVPAPPVPYATNLSGFNGSNPNGAWSLFIIDDSLENAGAISNGWSLNLIISNPIGSAADAAVSITASPNPVVISSNLTYIIGVTNYGPSPSAGVVVTNTLPSGVTFVSAAGSQGTTSLNGSLLAWNVGSLATNAGAALVLVVRPAAAGSLVDFATVSSATPDPNPDDNSASYIVTVGTTQPPQISRGFLTGNGIFALTISNPTNPPAPVIIQASTNLVTGQWMNIYTSTPPFTFTNLDSTNFPMRFYRAVTGF
jgi:uncharacterized repeat protein (TIGR01451 family)